MLNIEFFVLITNLNAINAIEKWWEVMEPNLSMLFWASYFYALFTFFIDTDFNNQAVKYSQL